MRTQALVLAVVAAMFLTACSTESSRPVPGTPAFVWFQARQAYHNGDMAKTNDYLSELQQTDNAFTPRARIWQIVLAGGMAQGYVDLADAYAAGERINHDDKLVFHKQATALRALATHTALDFTQAVHDFIDRDPSTEVQFGFDLPPGSATEPAALRKPYRGIMPIDAEVATLQTAMAEHGVIGAICLANGAANDSAQMLARFQAEVKTPRPTFLFAAAKKLFEVSDLFSPNRLDEPQHRKVMCQQALDALQSIPDTDDTKALAKKLQAALKPKK